VGDCECPQGTVQCGTLSGEALVCCPIIGWDCGGTMCNYIGLSSSFSYAPDNKTYQDVFTLLNNYGVKYVVFGSFARYLHANTGSYHDIDILYDTSYKNLQNLISVITQITNKNKDKYDFMYSSTKSRTNVKINSEDSIDFINEVRSYDYNMLVKNTSDKLAFGVLVPVASVEDLDRLHLLRKEDQNQIF